MFLPRGDRSNSRNSVLPHFQTLAKKKVEKKTRSGIFLTNFEVSGNVLKHCLKCLIYNIFLIETKAEERKKRNKAVKKYTD